MLKKPDSRVIIDKGLNPAALMDVVIPSGTDN